MRRVLATGLLLLAQDSRAVPPPLPQTGADCERPTYASDQLVCGDAALLALDRRVQEAWQVMVAARAGGEKAAELPPLLESQESWFGRRSRCAFLEAHAACLQAAYLDRAGVLDAWQRAVSGSFADSGTRVRCAGAPWGDATVVVHRPMAEARVLISPSGQTLAIATLGGGPAGWRPYVQFDAVAPALRLSPLSGGGIVCRPR